MVGDGEKEESTRNVRLTFHLNEMHATNFCSELKIMTFETLSRKKDIIQETFRCHSSSRYVSS